MLLLSTGVGGLFVIAANDSLLEHSCCTMGLSITSSAAFTLSCGFAIPVTQ